MNMSPKTDVLRDIHTLWGDEKYDIFWGLKISSDDPFVDKRLYALDQALLRLSGRRHFILALEEVNEGFGFSMAGAPALKHPNQVLILPQKEDGRRQEIKIYLETACSMQADFVILPDEFPLDENDQIPLGFLENFFDSLQDPCDFVVGFLPGGKENEWEQCGLTPLLEAFYGIYVPSVQMGAWGIRLEFAEELYREMGFWAEQLPEPGMLFWMLTRSFLWKKKVRAFSLPPGSTTHWQKTLEKNWIEAVMRCIHKDRNYCFSDLRWLKTPEFIADDVPKIWNRTENSVKNRLKSWTREFYGKDIESMIPPSLPQPWPVIFRTLFSSKQPLISEKDWAQLQLWLLMEGAENWKEAMAVWETGWAAFIFSWFSVKPLDDLVGTLHKMRREITKQLRQSKQEYAYLWQKKVEADKDALIPMYYMEYVPGRPIVIPKKISGRKGQRIETEAIYRELRSQFEQRMQNFLHRAFGRSLSDSPTVLRASMQSFTEQTELILEKILPGDLHTKAGLSLFLHHFWKLFQPAPMLAVQENLLREMLVRFPPVNLMLTFDVSSPEQLLRQMSVQDAVALAGLLEENPSIQPQMLWLSEHLRPEQFTFIPVAPLILEEEWESGGIPFGRISRCDKVTGRILVRPLAKGKGGQYPRLRYFFELLRRVVQLRLHSELLIQCIQERRELGTKFQHCLNWNRGGSNFSAAQIFENSHHRRVCQMLREAMGRLQEQGQVEAARRFRLIAYGYGVSQVLRDGTFLTCTIWSWAGYSFKGGRQVPNALTTSIEERWFNHCFLESLCREIGFSAKEFTQTVKRQIMSGHDQKNLFHLFVPAPAEKVEVLVQSVTEEPAGRLKRYEKNPLLQPIKNHSWENRYVLNPGALRIEDRVYLFYRAVGEDGISRIGLAITDGYQVLRRLPDPIFTPQMNEERQGCEDPRVVLIQDKIWMLYTAYDGNIAQVAAATIRKDDFLKENFDWKREGLAFRNIWDKDAILFPEKIQGQYILYHRIEPSIWYTGLPELQFPCWERQTIILGPRPGQQWDSLKIGAGAQPLKTAFGWLLFYHGVDQNYVYRLGVLLADLQNPQKILYRSPNAVLEPVAAYEIGNDGSWVPNVVFTCGAVGAVDKEILEEDDEVLVYYGAADSSIGVAYAKISDLIPAKYRSV